MKTGSSHHSTNAIANSVETTQLADSAILTVGPATYIFPGKWIYGGPWERFGLYNAYVVVREDGEVFKMSAHAGELVPGSTEDLIQILQLYDPETRHPGVPLTLELDPTYFCFSKDCGGHCFSAPYRRLNPRLTIPTDTLKQIIETFAASGGRIVRFDGGGDPLAHSDVRNGKLPQLAQQLGLKSTILTAGDALSTTNLEAIGSADCYLRISLNAATDEIRQKFHGNNSSIVKIFTAVSRFAYWRDANNPGLPIGGTYLLSDLNYQEVYDCATRSKECGINHFSVRRILGTQSLRPHFSNEQLEKIEELFKKIRELADAGFRVFLPWRNLNEPDPDPSSGEFVAASCWQSSFKAILEPSAEARYKVQLCGRYRGDGVGQEMQLSPLFHSQNGTEWVNQWNKSFKDYPIPRSELPFKCVSCIDRGFIKMMDNLLSFLQPPRFRFKIFHLADTSPVIGASQII